MSGLEVFNIIVWVFWILSFLLSIFIANKVLNINKSFNTDSDLSEVNNELEGVEISWNYTWRDNS